jgi:hypothetical protein
LEKPGSSFAEPPVFAANGFSGSSSQALLGDGELFSTSLFAMIDSPENATDSTKLDMVSVGQGKRLGS